MTFIPTFISQSPGSKIERIETLTGRYTRQQWDLINLLPYIKEGMVTKNGMAAQWTQCSKECNLLWVNGMVRNALLNKYWINWNVQLTFWFDQNQYLLWLERQVYTFYSLFLCLACISKFRYVCMGFLEKINIWETN